MVAVYAAENDPQSCANRMVTWSELRDLLTPREASCEVSSCPGKHCREKYGLSWSPVEIKGERLDMNVLFVTALVLDLDSLNPQQAAHVAARLAGYKYIAHSTHSHRLPDKVCMRVVMPISEPVAARDWPRVLRAAVQRLDVPADSTCKNVSRLYFTPRYSKHADHFVVEGEGQPIDVDEMLAAMPAGAVYVPVSKMQEAVAELGDLEGLHRIVHKVYMSKARSKKPDAGERDRDQAVAKSLKLVLDGKVFAVAGDHQGETDLPRGRDAAINAVCSTLAFALPPLTPWEVVVEVLRPSLSRMSQPEGPAHWLAEAEDMYMRAMKRRVESDLEKEKTASAVRAATEAWYGTTSKEKPPRSHDDVEIPELIAPEKWKEYLLADSKGGWRSCSHNVNLILDGDKSVSGHLRWNELSKTIEVTGGLFVGRSTDVLAAEVKCWLQATWGIFVTTREVGESLLLVARRNAYDPVRKYLESVTWDGVERLDGWLTDYCRVKEKNEGGEDIGRWVKLFASRWLIAAVARALEPGCQADNVLVLEGAQGIAKTTVFRVLGEPWFTDEKVVLGDKDGKMIFARSWIVELGELAALKKGDVETHKQVLSQKIDTFRPPYGAAVQDFPRRCVFGGTINPADDGRYLTDVTGNRRYWIVSCEGAIDVSTLRLVRDQLWAEAVVRYRRYKEGDFSCRWWLEADEYVEMEQKVLDQRQHRSEVMESIIRTWWKTLVRKQPFTITECMIGAMQMDRERASHADACRVGRALKRCGFDRRQRMRDGVVEYLYEPREKARALRAVPDAAEDTHGDPRQEEGTEVRRDEG